MYYLTPKVFDMKDVFGHQPLSYTQFDYLHIFLEIIEDLRSFKLCIKLTLIYVKNYDMLCTYSCKYVVQSSWFVIN